METLLCPAASDEIVRKLETLRSFRILEGVRGSGRADIDGYVRIIEQVSHLMAQFPKIMELDVNPVRLPADGSAALALDARCRIAAQGTSRSVDRRR